MVFQGAWKKQILLRYSPTFLGVGLGRGHVREFQESWLEMKWVGLL